MRAKWTIVTLLGIIAIAAGVMAVKRGDMIIMGLISASAGTLAWDMVKPSRKEE